MTLIKQITQISTKIDRKNRLTNKILNIVNSWNPTIKFGDYVNLQELNNEYECRNNNSIYHLDHIRQKYTNFDEFIAKLINLNIHKSDMDLVYPIIRYKTDLFILRYLKNNGLTITRQFYPFI